MINAIDTPPAHRRGELGVLSVADARLSAIVPTLARADPALASRTHFPAIFAATVVLIRTSPRITWLLDDHTEVPWSGGNRPQNCSTNTVGNPGYAKRSREGISDRSAAGALGTLLGILGFHLLVTIALLVTERRLTHATDASLHELEGAPLTDEARTIRGDRRQADMRALTGDTGSRGPIISSAVDRTKR